MSKVKRISLEDYKKFFSIEEDENRQIKEKHKEAIKVALDIRKFEIDLYWRRAGYFWLFMTADLTGYFAVEGSSGKTNWALLFLLSALGLVIALTFYFANKGSKFWQMNWERHVDLLEDSYMGPLYKCLCVSRKTNKLKPGVEHYFSVSKLNQWLVGAFVGLWLILLVRSGCQFCFMFTQWEVPGCMVMIGNLLWFVIVLVYVCLFVWILFNKCDNGDLGDRDEGRFENAAEAEDNSDYGLYLRK